MHSDKLNEDFICQLFLDEQKEPLQQPEPRREQVSLNLTVTSRDSRSQAHHTGKQQYPDPTNILEVAKNELEQFNKWNESSTMHNTINDSERKSLMADIDNFTDTMQDLSPMMLTMPDFNYIIKKMKKNNKPHQCGCQRNNVNVNVKAEDQFIAEQNPLLEKECERCKKQEELIQIINEEHEVKVSECQEKSKRIQELEVELFGIKNEVDQGELRRILLDGVEEKLLQEDYGLVKEENQYLKEENEELKTQLHHLKSQIQREKFQKSDILQKSNSLLRTKNLLEKRLQTVNQKSFSNAKNSTNPTNLNDSMNRMDSMMCFNETSPNIEELVKYYSEEMAALKEKIQKKLKELGEEARKKEFKEKYLSQLPQKQIYDKYNIIISSFKSLKEKKHQYPEFFNHMKPKKFDCFDTTVLSSQEYDDLKKTITILERDNISLQTENKNLTQTKDDLLKQISHFQEKLKEKGSELQRYQIEYRSILHKYRIEQQERKKLAFEIQDMKGAIRVYCRIRPRLNNEMKQKSVIRWESERKISKDGKEFEFDHIFNEKSTQQHVFAETKSLVEYAYEGKNLCIFAYGQTGSGKTFTIHGNHEKPGLAFNISNQLFSLINRDKNIYDTLITMSIVQIYKENIRDLLLFEEKKIQIKEDSTNGVYLQEGLNVKVKDCMEMMNLYEQGMKRRVSCQTEMNSDSSRSHCVLIINIKRSKRVKNDEGGKKITLVSKITLIDLAGAEKLTSSNPLIAKQTQFINKSLSSLVDVFTALKEKKEHVPYRNSKLTHLLKDSLTNKCNILTFINLSPNETNSFESSNSINFGMKARAIERSFNHEGSYLPPRSKTKQNKENQHHKRSSTVILSQQ